MSQLKQKFLLGIDNTKFHVNKDGAIQVYNQANQLIDLIKLDNQDRALVLGQLIAYKSEVDQALIDAKAYTDQQVGALDFTPYLKHDGSVLMTGDLQMNSHSITQMVMAPSPGANDATTVAYVDSAASSAQSAAQSYADGLEALDLRLDGSRAMSGGLNMGGNTITINDGSFTNTVSAQSYYLMDNVDESELGIVKGQAGASDIIGGDNGLDINAGVNGMNLNAPAINVIADDYIMRSTDSTSSVSGASGIVEIAVSGNAHISASGGANNGVSDIMAYNSGQINATALTDNGNAGLYLDGVSAFAATMQFVNPADPSNPSGSVVAKAGEVDIKVGPQGSEMMFAFLPTGLDMSGQKISNVADPESAQDAATKAFVEGAIAAADLTSYVKRDGSLAMTGDFDVGGHEIKNVSQLKNLSAASVSGNALRYDELGQYSPGAGYGIASLDSAGKIPAEQLPAAIMEYKGTWDASTNTPALANGNPPNAPEDAGHLYIVSVGGTVNFGAGNISFNAGDSVILSASLVWEKSTTANLVSSVNGAQGVVVLDAEDLVYHQANTADWTVADDSSIKLTLDEVGSRLTAGEAADMTYLLLDGTRSMSGELNMAGHKISNVSDGSVSSDAVNKGQLDSAISSEVSARDAAILVETNRALAAESALAADIASLGAVTREKVKFTLSSTNIANGYVDFNYIVSLIICGAVDRVAIHEGASDDYTLSTVSGKTRLTFVNEIASGGVSALEAGDDLYFTVEHS